MRDSFIIRSYCAIHLYISDIYRHTFKLQTHDIMHMIALAWTLTNNPSLPKNIYGLTNIVLTFVYNTNVYTLEIKHISV